MLKYETLFDGVFRENYNVLKKISMFIAFMVKF